nr:antirestriction protein [Escherichia coli]MDN1631749.1 antirestriction protein [Escherichia coli]
MGSCAAPSAKGDDKFITTDYLQQCRYFCGLAYEEGKAELNETMANRYHLLREYVNTLENESQNRIYRAID